MGLLDDAIRDHLELKRRRGADPTEVERAEREALGPVRRHPEGSDELGYDDEHTVPAGEMLAADEDEIYDDEALAYDDDLEDDADWPERGAAHHPEPAYEAGALGDAELRHDPRWVDEEPFAEPDPGLDTRPHETVPPHLLDADAPPPHRSERLGDETAEHEVPSGQDPDDAREDVLEETPEFLQDAPDHDRLWFEQKPPRDFDFDG